MQLFSRLGSKRNLGTLNLPLFSSLPSPSGGLCPGDVVELSGGEGSGKSELLLNITAQCVLPRRWSGREIGGREVEVVWVSTDHKFDVLRLVAVLEGKLCAQQTSGDDQTIDKQLCGLEGQKGSATRETPQDPNCDYEALITSCLSRVHVVYCNSSTELGMTLQSLRLSLLRAHPDVCALVLDNVAEFYWADRAVSVHGSEAKQSMWVGALRTLIEDHHMVVFAAKPLLFAQRATPSLQDPERTARDKPRSDDVMCQQWRRLVRYRFLVTSAASAAHYTIQQLSPPHNSSHNFTVSAKGICFSSYYRFSHVCARAVFSGC